MFSLAKAKSFLGSSSEELKYDKQFESTCLLISKELNINAKTLTVLAFYSAFSGIKKRAEMEQKKLRKLKYK